MCIWISWHFDSAILIYEEHIDVFRQSSFAIAGQGAIINSGTHDWFDFIWDTSLLFILSYL